jgi:asparagine synthase (glutamine-hydrolysing)
MIERGIAVQDGVAGLDFAPTGIDIGWANWRWDGRAATVETCRYGIRPLFYHATARCFMIAPSIATLLALGAPDELDPAALAVYLRYETFLGEDTPFKQIRAMPPAGRLRWDGSLEVAGGLHRPEPVRASRAAAAEGYFRLFRAAIERSVDAPAIVPLSGGCDSRHNAFELARLGRLRACLSVRSLPPRSDEDVRVAARVARAIGASHEVVEQDPDRFVAAARTTEETSYCGREHMWFRPMVERLADPAFGDAPLLDGLGGDVLSAGLFLEPTGLALIQAGRIAALARHLVPSIGAELPFLSDPEVAPARLARARLEEELARHQGAGNPIGSFYFWNRTRRVVALQFFLMLYGHRVVTPYLDRDVFDFLAGLPAELFLDHQFHREALHRAFGEFAGLGFAPAGRENADQGLVRAHFRRYGRAILRRLSTFPSRLVDQRYALRRVRYLGWWGSPDACWTPDACLYLSQLEHAAAECESIA